ncbi:hypothetical protein [Paracoccus binzhouensis]|uniref:hypothetical protein n=1 Tax=Paracoccus binzhouensis TaxID=2796149 RepID=UPI0018EEEE59|nr:hypothetical protein [Paracoccus binzhouensis]
MKPILTAGATFPAGATLPHRLAVGPAVALLALLIGLAAPPLRAQEHEAQQPEAITLELNGATPMPDGACQLTLVVTNGLPAALKRAAWQVAIFDKAGAVQSLPILDFGALLPGKTRVAQFALPGRPCDQLGRIVVNDVAECTAEDGADQRAACLGGLATRNRSEIEFGL